MVCKNSVTTVTNRIPSLPILSHEFFRSPNAILIKLANWQKLVLFAGCLHIYCNHSLYINRIITLDMNYIREGCEMSEPSNKRDRMRTAVWLELSDSSMTQNEIRDLVGVSQPTVSRAISIADGREDGPFTDDMNEVIDRYIIVRDEQKAEIKRIQQAAAERAAAAKARREKKARRERLRAWVDDELDLDEQDSILRRYRLDRSPAKSLTPDDELDVLVRHLKQPQQPPSPPVQRNTQPPRQTTSPPVRRKVSPPQQPPSPPVGPTRQVSSHSTKTIDVGNVVLASGVVLAVLMLVVGVVILASNDTVRELWSVVNDRSPYWGPILGLLSSLYMRLPVGKDEPAAGTLWTMKILMFPTFVVSVLIVFSWLYNLNGMDLVSGL